MVSERVRRELLETKPHLFPLVQDFCYVGRHFGARREFSDEDVTLGNTTSLCGTTNRRVWG